MDAKLLYWTGAFINFGVVCTLALIGVRRIRAKDIRGHRRMMLTSSALVFGFLVSYVLKVSFLGKENLKVWDTFSLWSLHIHESWILVMILAGEDSIREVIAFPKTAQASCLMTGAPTAVPEAQLAEAGVKVLGGTVGVEES